MNVTTTAQVTPTLDIDTETIAGSGRYLIPENYRLIGFYSADANAGLLTVQFSSDGGTTFANCRLADSASNIGGQTGIFVVMPPLVGDDLQLGIRNGDADGVEVLIVMEKQT